MIPLISISASLTVFLAALWYLRNKNEQEVRFQSLAEQQRMIVEQNASFNQRVAFPVVDGLVRGLMSVLPTSLVSRARRWLVNAGDSMTVSQFFTIVLITATLPAAAYLVFIFVVVGEASAILLFLAVMIAVMGIILPLMLLRRAARNRQKRILRSIPNAIDLMTTCVEAGLSLDFALQRVAQRYKGPLSDEINRTLREVGLGKTRREGLTDMAERIDVPDISTFINSIVQAEMLGTSIGQVLRVQAKQLRTKRRQRAEQMARQAPVKMVFPLVLFLMPSLFIVTIGPVVLNVIDAFSKA
jgi:tight adherence protein C